MFRPMRRSKQQLSIQEPEEIKTQQIQGCTRSLIIAVDVVHGTGKEAKELMEGKKSAE